MSISNIFFDWSGTFNKNWNNIDQSILFYLRAVNET